MSEDPVLAAVTAAAARPPPVHGHYGGKALPEHGRDRHIRFFLRRLGGRWKEGMSPLAAAFCLAMATRGRGAALELVELLEDVADLLRPARVGQRGPDGVEGPVSREEVPRTIGHLEPLLENPDHAQLDDVQVSAGVAPRAGCWTLFQ